MPRAEANGIELEYDAFGDPADPALLLIMGLATQMTAWDPRFCALLADRGFHVIRYDNRDAGLSTQFDDLPDPDVFALLGGDTSSAPYLLADLAADAVGLLDALGIGRAHVVGVSMGGMIGQELAINHPERVLSLSSIMSTTGDRAVGQPSHEALAALLAPAGADREQAIERGVNVLRVIGSPAPELAVTDEWRRERAAAAYDRANRPAGGVRQLAAIVASPDRTRELGKLTIPVLVMHGDQDQLINVSGGEATAAAIPGAELIVFPGLGHDLPEPLWTAFVDGIARNAAG